MASPYVLFYGWNVINVFFTKYHFSHFYHAVVYTSRAAYQLIWPFHFLSHVTSHMYCDGICAAMSLVRKLKSFMDINEWIVYVANIWGQPSKISGFYRDMHDKLSEYKVNRSTTPTVDMSLYLVQSSRNMGYIYINQCEVICSTVIMSAVSTCKFGRMIFLFFCWNGWINFRYPVISTCSPRSGWYMPNTAPN